MGFIDRRKWRNYNLDLNSLINKWIYLHAHALLRGPDLYDDEDERTCATDGSGPSTSVPDHRKERTPQQV